MAELYDNYYNKILACRVLIQMGASEDAQNMAMEEIHLMFKHMPPNPNWKDDLARVALSKQPAQFVIVYSHSIIFKKVDVYIGWRLGNDSFLLRISKEMMRENLMDIRRYYFQGVYVGGAYFDYKDEHFDNEDVRSIYTYIHNNMYDNLYKYII